MISNYKIFFSKVNQVLLDIFVFLLAVFSSYFIRFEGIPGGNNLRQLLILFPYIVIARILSFHIFSVYSIVWRYISINDAILIFKASYPITVLLFLGRIFLPEELSLLRIPFSVITLEFLLVLIGSSGIRMLRRSIHELSRRESLSTQNNNKMIRVLLIGAGDAGNLAAKELKQRLDLGLDVVGFVDDDPLKFNTVIQGIKVLGNTTRIPEIVKNHNIDEAIITIANASSKDIRRIVDVCKGMKIRVKIVPGLSEILDDKVRVNMIREININDLLGRSVVHFEDHFPEVTDHYKDKRILITGAGGSIGSELCRQLAPLWPKELILLDKDENSIFEINSEFNRESNGYNLSPLIADIRYLERLEYIFKICRPEIIFHAAAHKHVPLMEFNQAEAILNNVLGTKNVAHLAIKYGVKNFIYISTDKAVNPASVMGASKKVGEIIVQEIASKNDTKFSCVRFGNVLGSRGSVVPLFQNQIARGGPITVTHPDVERYFMSISEAVQLIIQAGTIGNKGEIFVLDMGKPVKILDLAKDLMRLSGFGDGEIEIKYIGLRMGEKLYEETLIDEERMRATQYQKIFVAPPLHVDTSKFSKTLDSLLLAAHKCDERRIGGCLKEMEIGYNREKGFE